MSGSSRLLELDAGFVAAFMRQALRALDPNDPNLRMKAVLQRTMELIQTSESYIGPPMGDLGTYPSSHPYWNSLVGVYFKLMGLGYLIPQVNAQSGQIDTAFFSFTERGWAWANEQRPIPEDPQGYLAALAKLVPEVDRVVHQYVDEALATYNQQRYFAAAVMIGAASEKTLYLLLEAMQRSVKEPQEKAAIKNLLDVERSIPQLFKKIAQVLEQARRAGMPYQVLEGCENHLRSFQDAVRVQRNKAVHPDAAEATPEMVHLSLAAFPYACRKMYDLIVWFMNWDC